MRDVLMPSLKLCDAKMRQARAKPHKGDRWQDGTRSNGGTYATSIDDRCQTALLRRERGGRGTDRQGFATLGIGRNMDGARGHTLLRNEVRSTMTPMVYQTDLSKHPPTPPGAFRCGLNPFDSSDSNPESSPASSRASHSKRQSTTHILSLAS